MHTLVIGDHFVPASAYIDALSEHVGAEFGPVTAIDWDADKATQHTAQQLMETSGANAIEAPAEILDSIGDAEIVCTHFAPVGAKLIRAAERLRLIAVARAGLENVDVVAATERGVGVVPIYGRNASAVAELQIGLMLAETRNIARADYSIRGGGWRKDFGRTPLEVAGRTVGMVGFGHVGSCFVRKLSGFGCRFLAYDPYAHPDALSTAGVERVDDLDGLFSESDFVVVQARHTSETDRFIGADQFKRMKPDAYFINAARSRLVDMDALYDALVTRRIAGAALDVYDAEPLPDDSPWRRLQNVTMTTHFGGDTVDTNRASAGLVASAISEYVRTGRVIAAANAAELGWA